MGPSHRAACRSPGTTTSHLARSDAVPLMRTSSWRRPVRPLALGRSRRRFNSTLPALEALHPLAAPVAQWSEGFIERATVLGERVFDLGWHLAEHLAMDEAILFHLAQLLDQHLLADAGQATPQLAEAADAVVVQLPQDQRFPFARHHVHRGVDATDVRATSGCGGHRTLCLMTGSLILTKR